MRFELGARRSGYLTVDALVGLAVAAIGVSAAISLAASAVTRLTQAGDRLTAARIADDLYEDIYAGARPDGQHTGVTDGRSWTYESLDDDTSIVRRVRIRVARRAAPDLIVDAVVPPVPATASSSS